MFNVLKGKKRLVVALVIAAALAVSGGVWFWLDQDDTTQDHSRLAFPDLDALGLDEGGDPAELCATVGKTMKARGYQLPSAPRQDSSGTSCRFITSGLSLLTEGSPSLNVDFTVWRDNAERQYGVLRDDFRRDQVTSWPVGDVGFVAHRQHRRAESETMAVSRSGNDLIAITVWGSSLRAAELDEPLAEGVAHDEITDILRALTGDGEPGEPRIAAPPALEQAPHLADLASPQPLLDPPAETACAAFGDVAGKTGTQAGFTHVDTTMDGVDGAPMYTCEFAKPDPAHRPEGDIQREVRIKFVTYQRVATYSREDGGIRLSSLMTRDLLTAGVNPRYELPVGDGGYVSYTHRDHAYSETTAGYVVNGRTYVWIHIRASAMRDGNLVPLPEETAVKDIATLLT